MVIRSIACFVALCVLLFFVCYAGTGNDAKNMRSFRSYPKAVQDEVRKVPQLAGMVPSERSQAVTFVSNLVLFAVVLAMAGFVIRPANVAQLFLSLLVVGEGLNLFDFAVIDLLWWRNSPRIRFTGVDDPALYRDARPHAASFWRGVLMFAFAAGLVSGIAALVG